MSLEKYRGKRRFQSTPEPVGKRQPSQGPLRFVVQMHQATRLHYDFRIELEGTLKSWAVPRGPSMNPLEKRLAVMVEDHPLEYADFEGLIPEGNYGAGTVMVWDRGTYHVPEIADRAPLPSPPGGEGRGDRAESERLVATGLRKGRLRVVLQGKKLKGEFSLIKFRKAEENAWLLRKIKDAYATLEDVTWKDRSVVSRRTLAGIARDKSAVWASARKPKRGLRRLPPLPAAAENRSHRKRPASQSPATVSQRAVVSKASPLTQPSPPGGEGRVRGSPSNVTLPIGGDTVQLTNLQKVYWPDDGYTKADLLMYYHEVAEFILPYLKDRPASLNRHPDGIYGFSFFQKDMRRQPPPPWLQTTDIESDDAEKQFNRYALCQNEQSLLYLANLGCIEFNPWNSRVGSLERADYLVIDLDPEAVSFDRVVEAAQVVRRILERIGAHGVCKTSGKRGLHIYVPLGAAHTHEEAKQFAELIAALAHRQSPTTTSILRMPAQRQKRVYLDFLQNGKGKTLAAPYSARPYPGATVSTPLKWSEVKRGLTPAKFTIKTIRKRLDRVGDLWRPILASGIDLPRCLEKVAALLGARGSR